MVQSATLLYNTLSVFLFISISSAQQAYQMTALKEHNKYRATHHSPDLVIDNNMNNAAVQCAEYYVKKRTIDHSCPFKNGAGENLVGGAGNWSPTDFSTMAPKMWYDEVKVYNYNKPGFSMSTGHFTQLVWKLSRKFGFGVVNANGFTAGVALYDPPGNYAGQFPQNVLRP